MFRWNFARSAEAFFSRWAIKRVCKFLLKKKLGDFILGDIDLDQLEVQLTRGTIQLSDLAVNVDCINEKLAGASVVLKEGSIASLSIKIPWKLQNCEIELEELELVLAPFTGRKCQVSNCSSDSSSIEKVHMSLGPGKIEPGTGRDAHESVSPGIHEGVKTIAKIVKWLLSSFHVRLKKFIVAYDPCLEVNENPLPFNKSLVLRIAETEFGTCLSEGVDKAHSPSSDYLLGMTTLTNFVKFEDAVIEVLTMSDTDKSSQPQDIFENICNECTSSNLPVGSAITILTGRHAGISGRMNLCIPWKNGSLDIHKIDAAVSFDPIELRLQPSTIEWIIYLWESIKHASTAARSVHSDMMDSSYSNSRLYSCSSLGNSGILSADNTIPSVNKFSEVSHPGIDCKIFPGDLYPQTHIIQDWVPLSFKEDEMDLAQDYGASIDQFFDCFDGWQNCKENSSGTNGLWNWTYSVFSAINVASNVASGSGCMLTEQHFETCFRATVAGFSLLLYFQDEEKSISGQLLGSDKVDSEPYGLNHTHSTSINEQSFNSFVSCFSLKNVHQSTIAEPNPAGLKIHHLDVRCQDAVFNFQIGLLKKDYLISIKHVKIDEYYNKSCCDLILTNKTLKQNVLSALVPLPFPVQEFDPKVSVKHCGEKFNEKNFSQEHLIKVGFMESFGDCSFHCVVSLAESDESSASSTSFSMHLAPSVLWFHFHLVDSLLILFKKIENYFMCRDLLHHDIYGDKKLISPNDMDNAAPGIKTVPAGDHLQGNVVFSHVRIIICFPMQIIEDFGHLYPMENFIILEHTPLLIDENVSQLTHLSSKQVNAPNNGSCTPTFTLHFELGTFNIFLTDFISNNITDDQSISLHMKDVTAVKVLSVINRTGDMHSGACIVWQKGPVTGPGIANRVWSMASTLDHRSRNKVTGKNCEFTSVAAVNDFEGTSSDVRQSLILSSEFLLQLRFSIIRLKLNCQDYKRLNYLFDIVKHGLLNGDPCNSSVSEDRPLSKHVFCQATVIMNCDVLDLCISNDKVSDCSHSVQKELEGSWNCFRLKVEMFEIMSVSNIGGINGASFFRLIHADGQLQGSIFKGNDSTSVTTRDMLLASCMNSASRRGDGDGANVLSFGSAGTTITYICNPQLFHSYTSILVHCGTIVSPGGRLDWISDLFSFFSSPSETESSHRDAKQAKPFSNCATYEASFFLDLVDVALSYEPHFKHPVINSESACVGCYGAFEANQELSEKFVSCLLAASSFSLSNHAISNSRMSDYNIQLQDLGLLICESSGLNNDYLTYDVSYLQKSGYAKVASGILLVAVLKNYGSKWELEGSDWHISFDTCHDTTHGLFRLIAQLQQLYAPDIEDALAHLQSRWKGVQQSHNTSGFNDASDHFSYSISSDAGKKLPRSNDKSQSVGLLDGIIENAFSTTLGSNKPLNPSVICQNNYTDNMNLNLNLSLIEEASMKMSSKRSPCNLGVDKSNLASNSGLHNNVTGSVKESFPQLIDSYYYSEIIAPPLSANGATAPVRDLRWKPSRADVGCGKGGWYKDGYPMVVDNHISNSTLLDIDPHEDESNSESVGSDTSAKYSEKGKIILKNIDVRWKMFTGSDWSKQMKNSTRKDGSLSLEFIFSGLNILYAVYPEGVVNVSKLSVDVEDFNLYDRTENAPWKMVIGNYESKDHPRESQAKAFKLDLETVKPDPLIPLEDYRLYLEFLPTRLHLDQSQINFFISFFGDQSSVEVSSCVSKDFNRSIISEQKNKANGSLAFVEEALLPFFQKCDVKPLVVRIDYIPRHMDLASLRNGNYAELLNLVPWKGIDLQLKQVCAVGLYGWASVCETVVGQWLEDISHNQVHKLIKGLAPVKSLVSVASGTSKLVTLPVKSYKKDRKLLKGMQRGAVAFFKSISLEAVGLGLHLASGAHEILLQTECILANVSPNIPSPTEKSRIRKSANFNQPEGAQEGILKAYESLSDGLSRTASGVIRTPINEYRRGAGAGSALATAVRAAPAAAIAPVTASAHAVHCALLGMRNSLDPEHKKESMNKYLGPSRP